MSDKPVVVYGASGYTGRLICEYLREYNVPFIAAGRDKDKLKASMASNVAGIETADYDVVEPPRRRRVPDRAVQGRLGRVQHRRPVQHSSARRSSRPAWPPACHYIDTTGEQDWLITCDEQYGARLRRRRPAALARHRADVHDRRDRGPAVPGEAGPRHPRHRRLLGRQPDHRVHADDPGQRGARPRRTTWSRTATSRGTPRPGSTSCPSPASTSSPSPCPGAGPRTRCGSARTRAWPTSRRWAASSTSR